MFAIVVSSRSDDGDDQTGRARGVVNEVVDE
jgi:hypothetical protein